LARAVRKYPQVLINVHVADKHGLAGNDIITQATRDAAARLNDFGAAGGRVLVRVSGTEPLVRVMVEASTEEIARREADALAALVKQELG
jgi:phosphoglucosamine mutase